MSDKLIEAAAKAAYDARHKGLTNCWQWDDPELDVEHPETRKIDRTCARAILALISRTHRLVPIEPGEGEIEVLAKAICFMSSSVCKCEGSCDGRFTRSSRSSALPACP